MGEAGGREPSRGCWGCILPGLANAKAVARCTPLVRWVLRPPSDAQVSPGGSWGKHILLQTSWGGLWASPSLFLACSDRHSAGVACHSLGCRRCVFHLRLAGRVWWSGKQRGACDRVNPDLQNLPRGRSDLCPTLQSWSRTAAGLCVSAGVCAPEWAGNWGLALPTSPSRWAWQTRSPRPESRGAPLLPAVSRSTQSLPSLRRYSAGLFHAAGWRPGKWCHGDGLQACGPWSNTQQGPRAPPLWWMQRLQMPRAGWARPGSPVQWANSVGEFLKIKRHSYKDDIQ